MLRICKKCLRLDSLLLLAVMILIGCDKKNPVDPPEPSSVKVSLDPSNPLLISVQRSDSSRIDFYGTKDVSGQAVSLDYVISIDGTEESMITYGESALPKLIVAPNGVWFSFNWLSNTRAVVTAIAADGLHQLSTEIDFSGSSSFSTQRNTEGSSREGKPVSGKMKESDLPHVQANSLAMPSQGNVSILVQNCGEGELQGNSFVTLHVYDANPLIVGSKGLLGVFPASFIGNGEYVATIPTGSNTANFEQVFESLLSTLGLGCTAMNASGFSPQLLCLKISAALAATGWGLPIAAPFEADCAIAVGLMQVTCAVGWGSGDVTQPSLADILADADIFDYPITGDVRIFAKDNSLPPAISNMAIAPGDGPYPQLIIDQGSEAVISSLQLIPEWPLAGEDYKAVANIFCLPTNTTVEMSIVGTDEYQDAIQFTIDEVMKDGTFELSVPGAEAGVQDVVTVKVTLPSGEVKIRTASLVFGG